MAIVDGVVVVVVVSVNRASDTDDAPEQGRVGGDGDDTRRTWDALQHGRGARLLRQVVRKPPRAMLCQQVVAKPRVGHIHLRRTDEQLPDRVAVAGQRRDQLRARLGPLYVRGARDEGRGEGERTAFLAGPNRSAWERTRRVASRRASRVACRTSKPWTFSSSRCDGFRVRPSSTERMCRKLRDRLSAAPRWWPTDRAGPRCSPSRGSTRARPTLSWRRMRGHASVRVVVAAVCTHPCGCMAGTAATSGTRRL